MASRKEQKEQARRQRLAQEQTQIAQQQRRRRFQILGGAVSMAVIAIVAVIVIAGANSTSPVKPESAAAKAAAKHVDSLLAGIPQTGRTLGKSSAPVTITEFGDLECSICDVLATPTSFTNPEGEKGSGWLDRLITEYVASGKVKLVYRSLETASSGNPKPAAFEDQQAAAYAAGLQGTGWQYIELMYNEQGHEDTGYVTQSYLEDLARQVPGLDFQKWNADRKLASIEQQVKADGEQGVSLLGSSASTPTLVVSGPRGNTKVIVGLPQGGYRAYTAAINAVS